MTPISTLATRSLCVAALSVLAVAAGFLAPTAAQAATCSPLARNDLDGGGPDLVLGLPSYDLPGKPDAGAIAVFSNVAAEGSSDPRPPTARTLLTADDVAGLSAQAGARFGTSPVLWHEPGDPGRCVDLLVGAPGQDVAGRAGAGAVYQLQGGPDGLGALRRTYHEANITGAGGAQAGAHFGSAIAVSPGSTIAVGAPGRDVEGAADAGRVVRLDYLVSPVPEVRLVQQGGTGAGAPEPGDRFGSVLVASGTGLGTVVVIGVPAEDVGSRADAGAVAVAPLNGPLSMVTQDSPGAGGSAEPGDRWGAAVDVWAAFEVDHPVLKIAAGAPGEDVGSLTDAGLVGFAAVDLIFDEPEHVAPVRGVALTLHQDSPGVVGRAERGDRYGAAVQTAEIGTDAGRLHLVAGSPGEDLGTLADAGSVTSTRIDPTSGAPVAGSQPPGWTQDSPGVYGVAERGDRFGSALSAVQLTTAVDDEDTVWALILATSPGEDAGSVSDSGMAHVGVPGGVSEPLIPRVAQAGAGAGLAPVRMLIG